MKRHSKAIIITSTIGVLSLGFLSALTLKNNKKFKPGDYISSEDAYLVAKVDNPVGAIKGEKTTVPTDNYYSTQKNYSHGTNMIGDIESVWSTYTGAGTKIAIIDDGFDVNHPEYVRENGTSALLLNKARYYYYSSGYVYNKTYTSDNTCLDQNWDSTNSVWATHGTTTSTTAAAPINNGGVVGIAPEADILPIKVDMTYASIYYAIQYAVDQGVDVINISIAGYAESFTSGTGKSITGESGTASYLNTPCNNAYNAGVIIVASAGNDATYHKSYPACSSHVIGVGALGQNTEGTLAPFTNYVDSSQSGEINVDILAPGFVYTAKQSGTQNSITHTYGSTQGTSFSSPIVAGAACLWKEKNPNGTPDEFLQAIQMSASDIGSYENKYIPVSSWYSQPDAGPSDITSGRLNISELLIPENPVLELSTKSINIFTQESQQINVSYANGELSYSSNNTSVATVSNTGLVTGVGAGNATITVTCTIGEKSVSDTVSVTVGSEIAVSSLVFSPKSITLDAGDTYDAEATLTTTPSNADRYFMFTSSNESVATVDEDTGLVTAVGEGTALIEVIPWYGSGYDYLTVTVNGSVASYSHMFTYSEQGTGTGKTWTLSNCSDSGDYWLCPTGSSPSIALFSGIFSGKEVTSAVVITINSATYGSGGAPTESTYSIYNSEACTTQVSATKSGTLPSSSTYTNVVYTVSQANAANFVEDLAIKITKPGKQIRLKSIKVVFSYRTAPAKVVSSLSASYTGGKLYVGDSLDESALEVTASYTDSKYPTSVLSNTDYSLSGFSSTTAGTKTITVTYTGPLNVISSPMTTTFDVEVYNDVVTDVTASCSKSFHPGETIVKSDITMTLTFESGLITHPTDFSFTEYQFTYEDTLSGGTSTNKQLHVTYLGENYNFTVSVSRSAYVTPSASNKVLTGAQGKTAGITGTGATSATDYSSLNINGVICSATSVYVYNSTYFSFGKGAGEIHNTNPLSQPISSFTTTLKSDARTDEKLYVSESGSSWVLLSDANLTEANYFYFKVAYESESSKYSNFSNINLGLKGVDTPANVSNFIMYEDTEGQCVSKLGSAIDKLNNMSTSDKSTFWSSNDYVIKIARERIQAWAAHEGKTLSYSGGLFVISGSNGPFTKVNNNNTVLIVLAVMMSMTCLGGLLFLKKKKTH